MKVPRHLTYANVMSTIAVFGVLAGGGAYAASKIGSKDIKRNAVTGKHIKRGAVKGKHVKERTLDARGFSAMNGIQELTCDPSGESFVDCASLTLDLHRSGRVFVVATGAGYSEGSPPAKGNCQIRTGDADALHIQAVGEESASTSATATDGFARTLVTPRLRAGRTRFTLACNQVGGDLRVASPTIAAFAMTNG
jgi:hypothetical protein